MPEANPRTESLFWSALAIASPEERGRYLDQACGGDPQLRGRHVGDIAISVERAQAQAAESTVDELRLLAIHGVLHCLGHDHDSASRATAMTEVTRSLLPDQQVPELLGP